MCTILVAWRCLPGVPAVVAANRDEAVGRPTAPPGILTQSPRVAGGRDLLAGGTWLAVAADGRVAAVTNRHAESRDPSLRSRGEVPLLLLAADDPGRAMEAIDAPAYNPFNVLWVTRDRALVGQGDGGGRLRLVELQPGPHVLTVHDLDDAGQSKVAFLSAALAGAVERSRDRHGLLAAMEEVLTDHGDDGRGGVDVACVHGEGYGTVSSSSVVLGADSVTYRHAAGRPCVTPREDVSALLR